MPQDPETPWFGEPYWIRTPRGHLEKVNRLFIGGKSPCPRNDPADAPDSLLKSLSCPLAKVHLRLRCSEPEPYRKESGHRARRSQGTLQAFRNWELAPGIPPRWQTVPKPTRLRHAWTKPPPWRGIPWPYSADVSSFPTARPPTPYPRLDPSRDSQLPSHAAGFPQNRVQQHSTKLLAKESLLFTGKGPFPRRRTA